MDDELLDLLLDLLLDVDRPGALRDDVLIDGLLCELLELPLDVDFTVAFRVLVDRFGVDLTVPVDFCECGVVRR